MGHCSSIWVTFSALAFSMSAHAGQFDSAAPAHLPQLKDYRASALAVHDGKLYLATARDVFVADIKSAGQVGPLRMIIHDIPDAGLRSIRTIGFAPDGMLHIRLHSTCAACSKADSKSGRRHPKFQPLDGIGYSWDPSTDELWCVAGVEWTPRGDLTPRGDPNSRGDPTPRGDPTSRTGPTSRSGPTSRDGPNSRGAPAAFAYEVRAEPM
jgi:hypothetical protein